MFNVYDKLPVCHDVSDGKPRTEDVLLKQEVRFSNILLEDAIQKGLNKCGYSLLSPIQKNALPLALTGTSIIAHAKSGTGKTLIFLLTALNIFLKTGRKTNLMCLIITPTREIAKQIYDVCKNISCFIKDLQVEYFIGGTALDLDVLKCQNCHIAIGAPGRIKHLLSLEALKADDLRLLVLDEVDALLSNKEFAIVDVVRFLPVSKQTIVCTATFSNDINQLLNPIASRMKYVTILEDNTSNVSSVSNVLIGVKQYVAPYTSDSVATDVVYTRAKLMEILNNWDYNQCFIFVNFISLVKSVYNFLCHSGLSVSFVSSEQTQSARIATLNKIKLNESRILVTTDLAARGIDVHNVNLVINIGIPSPPDVYIHRMGRAGRYGSEGAVITLIHEQKELSEFKLLLRAVITDPVRLYILPNTINKETLKIGINIFDCVPKPDPVLKAKYSFQRNIKEVGSVKGNKKKIKKKKSRKIINATLRVSSSEDAIENQEQIITVSECDNLENLLDQYVDNIRKEKVPIEAVEYDILANFFKPETKTCKFHFKDYSSFTSENFRKFKPLNASGQLGTPHESLLSLIRSVKLKNELFEKENFPLSIFEFLNLYKEREEIVCKHVPDTLCRYVREILNKICQLIPVPPPNKRISTKKAAKRASSIRHSVSSNEYTDNSYISTCTSKWANKLNKRSRKNYLRPADFGQSSYVKQFLPAQPNFGHNIAARIPITNIDPDLEFVVNRSSQRKFEDQIQCPKCNHRFTLGSITERRVSVFPSVIKPVNIFTDPRRAQEIWQNQINFIASHVSLLPR